MLKVYGEGFCSVWMLKLSAAPKPAFVAPAGISAALPQEHELAWWDKRSGRYTQRRGGEQCGPSCQGETCKAHQGTRCFQDTCRIAPHSRHRAPQHAGMACARLQKSLLGQLPMEIKQRQTLLGPIERQLRHIPAHCVFLATGTFNLLTLTPADDRAFAGPNIKK